MAFNETIRAAFLDALTGLEQTLSDEAQRAAMARVRDAGLELLDEHAMSEGLLEARDEQIAAQVELLTQVELPLLQVRERTLCIPLVGEFDAFRTGQIVHKLLTAAVERRVDTVVIDLTGALFRDVSTAIDLTRVFQALRLIGVRGAVSGLPPGLARHLVEHDEPLRGVTCFADLAEALADDERRRGT